MVDQYLTGCTKKAYPVLSLMERSSFVFGAMYDRCPVKPPCSYRVSPSLCWESSLPSVHVPTLYNAVHLKSR